MQNFWTGVFFLASTVVSQPLLRYDFTEEYCSNQTFSNLGSIESLPLILNSTTSTCSRALGVETKEWYGSPPDSILYGSHSVEPWLNHLKDVDNGITFSFWIQPLGDDGTKTPIFTIGDPFGEHATASSAGLTECDSQQIDLQLSLYHNELELVYRTSDAFFEPCQRASLTGIRLEPHKLYHVAIVLADKYQQVFINGQPSNAILKEDFDNTLQHWKKEHMLQFFLYRRGHPWYGRIYQFSLHSGRWDQNHVQSTMSMGLPPSKPYAISKQIRMNEEAEISPESHRVEWYSQPRSYPSDMTVPRIDLQVLFVDADVEELLEDLKIDHVSPPKVYYYITKLPVRGELYETDGTQLSGSDDGVVSLKDPEVIFLPRYNEYSALPGSSYASFEFCVSLHHIFVASQCDSTAMVSIAVDPVNDPPVAVVGNETYTVHEGDHEEAYSLRLSGVDIDNGDSIVTVQITSPPKMGYLYLSVSNFRDDDIFHGTLLSDLNFTVPGHEAYVEYRFQSSDQVLRNASLSDSFQFRVQDSKGSWSEGETVFIQVVPSVIAILQDTIVIREGDTATLQLHGRDNSGLNRSLGFFLDATPDTSQGRLVDSIYDSLEQGSVLASRASFPYEQGAEISFLPTPEGCSSGAYATASIKFRVVAFEEDDRIASVSNPIEQHIRIECNIKAVQISVKQDKYTARAFDAFLDDPCSGFMYNVSGIEVKDCTEAAIITGIQVETDAAHTDRVLVAINTEKGLLTINRDQRKHILPVGDQEEMRSSIKFFADPNLLDDVLSYLHFQSEEVGNHEITITILYGNCNGTEPFRGKDFDGSKSECKVSTQTIQIEVLKSISVPKELLFREFPWVPLPFTFIMLLLLKIKGKGREILAKKQEEEPEEQEEEKGVEEFEDEEASTTSTPTESQSIRWKQFYDEESGFHYYQNTEDSSITWEPPLNEDYIPAGEE